jgi:dTDP-4-dehydrorhamnose reductase
VADRIVITGAGGQLGSAVAREARLLGYRVSALTSQQWDITDAGAAREFVSAGDVVVNCAAFTAVDKAEAEPDRAHAVNAIGAGNVARCCAAVGARLIHVSTDYVFSGVFASSPRPYDLDDAPAPISVYGRTKLAGEQEVYAALPQAQVVRTSWVYTGSGSDFVAIMRKLAAGDGLVDVVDDQIGSPTYVDDLAGALLQMLARGITAPLLHAANGGAVSRYEQARAVFAGVGADPERVRPCGTDRHPRPAKRPDYSALSARQSAAAGLAPLRPWREALSTALASL